MRSGRLLMLPSIGAPRVFHNKALVLSNGYEEFKAIERFFPVKFEGAFGKIMIYILSEDAHFIDGKIIITGL